MRIITAWMAILNGVICQKAIQLVLDSFLSGLRLNIGSLLLTTHRLTSNGSSVGSGSILKDRVFEINWLDYLLCLNLWETREISVIKEICVWTLILISWCQLSHEGDIVSIGHQACIVHHIGPHGVVVCFSILQLIKSRVNLTQSGLELCISDVPLICVFESSLAWLSLSLRSSVHGFATELKWLCFHTRR